MTNSKHRESGQATTELILLFPLFILLTAGVLSVGYICWQGLRIQQAANLAARIQGQQRVSGSYSPMNNPGMGIQAIREDNGTLGDGDQVPDASTVKNLTRATSLSQNRRPPTGGVYREIYQKVRAMFPQDNDVQNKLFIPTPHQGITTDAVRVVRVLVPPRIMNFQMPSIMLSAEAYGGEDPHMYGLPRWGRTDGNAGGTPFYQTQTTRGSE